MRMRSVLFSPAISRQSWTINGSCRERSFSKWLACRQWKRRFMPRGALLRLQRKTTMRSQLRLKLPTGRGFRPIGNRTKTQAFLATMLSERMSRLLLKSSDGFTKHRPKGQLHRRNNGRITRQCIPPGSSRLAGFLRRRSLHRSRKRKLSWIGNGQSSLLSKSLGDLRCNFTIRIISLI